MPCGQMINCSIWGHMLARCGVIFQYFERHSLLTYIEKLGEFCSMPRTVSKAILHRVLYIY